MIQTEIKVTGLALTPALKNYVEAKILQLEKFAHSQIGSVRAEVEIGKTTGHHRSGYVFKAEIRLQVNGRRFYAVETTEDLYASLDKVKDEIARQVVSAQQKEQTLLRRGARRLKNFLRRGR